MVGFRGGAFLLSAGIFMLECCRSRSRMPLGRLGPGQLLPGTREIALLCHHAACYMRWWHRWRCIVDLILFFFTVIHHSGLSNVGHACCHSSRSVLLCIRKAAMPRRRCQRIALHRCRHVVLMLTLLLVLLIFLLRFGVWLCLRYASLMTIAMCCTSSLGHDLRRSQCARWRCSDGPCWCWLQLRHLFLLFLPLFLLLLQCRTCLMATDTSNCTL
mmetsp:Transcript_134548/g.268540  ORF Transcript_134548/g.268540 Transcript_134548/m.268540 type:complete len:215 (+) Transcript_134548:1276-1920(+)